MDKRRIEEKIMELESNTNERNNILCEIKDIKDLLLIWTRLLIEVKDALLPEPTQLEEMDFIIKKEMFVNKQVSVYSYHKEWLKLQTWEAIKSAIIINKGIKFIMEGTEHLIYINKVHSTDGNEIHFTGTILHEDVLIATILNGLNNE